MPSYPVSLPALLCYCVLLQVFLQRSAVNLLGVVLDVPEFFWSAPDHLQVRFVVARGLAQHRCLIARIGCNGRRRGGGGGGGSGLLAMRKGGMQDSH
jgi:hypothetical protein